MFKRELKVTKKENFLKIKSVILTVTTNVLKFCGIFKPNNIRRNVI